MNGHPRRLDLGPKSNHVHEQKALGLLNRQYKIQDMTPTGLGPRIKKLRKARGLSQVELARRVGITSVYLSNLESQDSSPQHRRPSLTTLEKLAKALKTSVGQLLGEKGSR